MIPKEVIKKVSNELGIKESIIKDSYNAYWKFIKDTIEGLNLKEDLTEEEFNKLRTNINIPSLGKLTCTYDKYKKTKNIYNNIKKLKEKLNEEAT